MDSDLNNGSDLKISATPGVRMMFLIKARETATHGELVAHWFANHMPLVIDRVTGTATGYIGTLFDPDPKGAYAWDGYARMQMAEAMKTPDVPMGTIPTDSFQEVAAPYMPWATREYVVIDGSEHLPVRPLTLNAAFPTTRSGFFKITFLVKTAPGTDFEAFFAHWLTAHATNVAGVMNDVGGFHYAVSHSLTPEDAPYAGMAELYFHDASGWKAYRETIKSDGMEEWAVNEGTLVLRSGTEMIGIP